MLHTELATLCSEEWLLRFAGAGMLYAPPCWMPTTNPLIHLPPCRLKEAMQRRTLLNRIKKGRWRLTADQFVI